MKTHEIVVDKIVENILTFKRTDPRGPEICLVHPEMYKFLERSLFQNVHLEPLDISGGKSTIRIYGVEVMRTTDLNPREIRIY